LTRGPVEVEVEENNDGRFLVMVEEEDAEVTRLTCQQKTYGQEEKETSSNSIEQLVIYIGR